MRHNVWPLSEVLRNTMHKGHLLSIVPTSKHLTTHGGSNLNIKSFSFGGLRSPDHWDAYHGSISGDDTAALLKTSSKMEVKVKPAVQQGG